MALDIATALATLRTVADTIKSAHDVIANKNPSNADTLKSLVDARIAALQVLDALSTAKIRITELENENREAKQLLNKREEHEFFTLPSGATVLRRKSIVQTEQAAPYICQHCLEDGKISALQPKPTMFQGFLYCHRSN